MHKQLVIIGTGSAGLPAGMYASRYKIDNLVIWGQRWWALATSHQVENWPGEVSDSGKGIMDKFYEHAEMSGSEIWNDMVTWLAEQEDGTFKITTQADKEVTCDKVLLATGNVYRKLWVPWENELLGSGVSYCATCDGMFFKDKDVVVVGWWNTAFTESLYLAEICNKVHILVRTDKVRAEDSWIDRVNEKENIEVHYFSQAEKLNGKFALESVTLAEGKWDIPCQWFFVAIGSDPNISLVDSFGLEKDTEGCIVVDKRQGTSHPNIYAAWDVTTNSNKFKQTIMSAAEWCLAANSIHEDLIR